MTDNDHYPEHEKDPWDEAIDALLAGELNQWQKENLKRAAEHDVDLANKIVHAEHLQEQLDSLGLERAPKSLTKRLMAIPRGSFPEMGGLMLAGSFASVLLIVALFFGTDLLTTQASQPSEREIQLARQEVLLTLGYLEQVSNQTQRKISHEMYGTFVNTLMPPPISEDQ